MINVTKPYLPELEEFIPLLEKIWSSGRLSNSGPFHSQFEQALAERLSLDHPALFCNATIALITAQQALGVQGEVITTPYSFVATAHSLHWMRNIPVFVDIDPVTLCVDPQKIEEAITERTTAIMPLHCYGNTCAVDAIAEIARKHGLKVIYDACHSFGVEDGNGSVLRYGDISVVSFHATKVFNTFEGGLLVASDAVTKEKINQLKNFGFIDETTVLQPGLNGKMSEFNAALGVLQLKYFDEVISLRGSRDSLYRELLRDVPGIDCVQRTPQKKYNYSYFPILVDPDFTLCRDDLYQLLKSKGIFGRRYFFPLISEFPMYTHLPSSRSDNLPVATQISRRVICLPMYPDLPESEVERVCDIIKGCVS